MFEPLGINTKTILTFSLAAVIVSMVAGNSMAYAADFSGPYDPANWAEDPGTGNGTFDESLAPDSIEITGSDTGIFIPVIVHTDYTITVPCDTTISFDWDYSSVDVAPFDSASYLIDGVATQLSNSAPDSGSEGIPVLQNEIFGFRVSTLDNIEGPGVLLITNFDGGCAVTDIEIDVDIKPGSDPNCINIRSHGLVPVAILGSAGFDVTDIDTSTLEIDGVSPSKTSIKDKTGDGFDDLNLKFKTQELVDAGSLTDNNELFVTGELNDATPISGSDIINLAGLPNCFD